MFSAESRLLPAAVPIAGLLEFFDKEGEYRKAQCEEQSCYQELCEKKEQYYPCRERQSAEYNAHNRVI